MAVISALRSGVSGLLRNPIIFAVTGIIALLQLPQFLAEFIDPFVASLVSFGFGIAMLVVVPFVQGGLIRMADEAIDGHTDVGTFLAAGKANYVTLLGAYALVFGVNMILGFVVVIPVFVVAVFVFGTTGSPSLTALLLIGGFLLLVGLAYAIVYFLIQFYAQAIVLDDQGIVDGFKRSYGVVRRNVVSTLGYTLVLVLFGGLFGAVVGAGSVLMSTGDPYYGDAIPTVTPELQLLLLALIVVGTTLFSAVFTVYSVAFYREISA